MSTEDSGLSRAPVAVFWDIENVPIPAPTDATRLTGSQIVLRMESALDNLGLGPIHEFKAFLDIGAGHVKEEMRSELQCSNVTLIDVTHVTANKKDMADKMLVVHLFSFALDNPALATIVLISGDVDFAMPLAALRMRKYHIVLVLPLGRTVNAKLKNLAHTICYFNDLLFPEKLYMVPTISADGDFADVSLLTPQALLKSKVELRNERVKVEVAARKEAKQAGVDTSSAAQRRKALVELNASRGVLCCLHCGKVNHKTAECYFRPAKQGRRGKNDRLASAPSTAGPRSRKPAKGATRLKAGNGATAASSKERDAVGNSNDDNDEHAGRPDDGYVGDDLDDDDDDEDDNLSRPMAGSVSDDDLDDLLGPQYFRAIGRSNDDTMSLLSEPAAQVHLQDLIDTLLDIRDGGETKPFTSRVGHELSRRYQFFKSGMTGQLIGLAEELGLVTLSDGMHKRVELNMDMLTSAAPAVSAAAATTVEFAAQAASLAAQKSSVIH